MNKKGFLETFDLPDPVCLFKNTWSTVNLWSGTTNSCHRVDGGLLPEKYSDFHNTPNKIEDRKKMLSGVWPDNGCLYCKKIEEAGGVSDRQEANSWKFDDFNPPELYKDKNAVVLTPRYLEVYFNNVCNLSCIYCFSENSSIWEIEDRKYGTIKSLNSPEPSSVEDNKNKQILYEKRVKQHWEWLEENIKYISHYSILGGEPFFQPEFEKNIDFFLNNPNENLNFSIFSNLKVSADRMRKILDKVNRSIETKSIRSFKIYCSLDCWGEEQEYTRTGLNIDSWEKNFNIILNEYPKIKLDIHSTVISLGIKTLPDLCEKVAEWNEVREVKHSLSIVDGKKCMHPGIWPNEIFEADWNNAIEKSKSLSTKNNIISLMKVSSNQQVDVNLQEELKNVLTDLDIRRNTNWQKTFKWLN